MPQRTPIAHEKTAVIDIGSNSVRLVIYHGSGPYPLPIYNEKILCQLGVCVAKDGTLDEPHMQLVMQVLARYKALIAAHGIETVIVLATAAMRLASNGDAFAKRIRKKLNLPVQIVQGEEEAELAALGVLSGVPDANGTVIDLGGGSTELAYLDGKGCHQPVSLPAGVLTLDAQCEGNRKQAKQLVKELLAPHEGRWKKGKKNGQIYCVGGSFRALAKLYMERENHPVNLVHQYQVDAKRFRNYLGDIVKMPDSELVAQPGVTRKRAGHLPYAALILRRLIKISGASQIVFSMHGIREGALFQYYRGKGAGQSPLIATAEAYARAHGGSIMLGRKMAAWMQPIFPDDWQWGALVKAAAQLATIPRYELSSDRSESAFHDVLESPLTGISHENRFLLALALMYRFHHGAKIDESRWRALGVASVDRARAYLLGVALNLANSVCAGRPDLLAEVRLLVKEEMLVLHSDVPYLLEGEVVQKRFERLERAWQELF